MTLPRIIGFTVLLVLLRISAGAAATVALGVELMVDNPLFSTVTGLVISISVFALMTRTEHNRPFLAATLVGLSAELIGWAGVYWIIGEWILEPTLIAFDFLMLATAVLAGVSLGRRKIGVEPQL